MMDAYMWADGNRSRLKRLNNSGEHEKEVVIICQKVNKIYTFYGRYTAHDNHLGYPIGEAMIRFIQLLKEHTIEYQLIESCDNTMGVFYTQKNAYVQLKEHAYKSLKKSPIL